MTQAAASEYVDARRVLLDALEALAPQRESFVLVGAQAIYARTGEVAGTGILMTTDSDLALDADLLSDDPELTTSLRKAGFLPDAQPGSWVGSRGIKVDVMVVPHQSNRMGAKNARAADLPPHGRQLARITPGLEPALVDNSPLEIAALDPDDDRIFSLRVAGPAALLAAKLVKVRERDHALRAGGRDRLKSKDVLDCYRLLMAFETEALCAGFASHAAMPEALATAQSALDYLREQHRMRRQPMIRRLLRQALPDDEVAWASFDALVDELLEALPQQLHG